MESGITTGPISVPRVDVLAETTYTHREEDFVAWWMYCWEETQNQRLHPQAHRLTTWTRLTLRRALAYAVTMFLSTVLFEGWLIDYILAGMACVFCCVMGKGLASWFLQGPKGPFRKLGRWRYRRKMWRTARQMAAQKTYLNLGRVHRLFLTPDSCIHLEELQENESGSRMIERRETITSWSAFDRIEITEHHVFLIERRNFTAILPRNAFPDEASFQQFVNLACRLHQDALQSRIIPAHEERRDERIML